MNTKKFFIALLIFSTLGCKEIGKSVVFEEPQPQNVRNINEIPAKIIGNYYDFENEKGLHIQKSLIYTSNKLKDTLSLSLLSNHEKVTKNTYYNSKTNESYQINRINDTLFSGYVVYDTLFNLKQKDVLKKFKGNYFLNTYNDEKNWDVIKLIFSKDVINLSEISSANDLKLMEEVTQTTKTDSLPLSVKPTKSQFKEFLKKQGFTSGNTYLKQK